jgi:hypothetical protein
MATDRMWPDAAVLDRLRSIYPRCSSPLFKVLEHSSRFFDAIFRHEQLNIADYAWVCGYTNNHRRYICSLQSDPC